MTLIWIFGSFFRPKSFLLVPSFQNMYGLFAVMRRNLLEIGFENTYFQVFQGFPALKDTVAHIQPNGQFWTVFGQNGQNGNFFQKSAWNIFLPLQALTNCKVSEKVIKGFRENKLRMDKRTNERTRAKFKFLTN